MGHLISLVALIPGSAWHYITFWLSKARSLRSGFRNWLCPGLDIAPYALYWGTRTESSGAV